MTTKRVDVLMKELDAYSEILKHVLLAKSYPFVQFWQVELSTHT